MATAIKYTDTAKTATARITTGVANSDGSGSISSFSWGNTAPAADWMPVKMVIAASSATGVGNPADCLIHIFLDDGTNIRRIRTIDPGDPAAGTTVLPEYIIETNFGPEWILPSTASLKVGVSVTPTAGNIDFVLIAQAA